MRVLVVGNGFDLEHGLPTKYSDFLCFCNYLLGTLSGLENPIPMLSETQKNYMEMFFTNHQLKDSFESMIVDNHLLEYFNRRKEKQGNNWIDFERELAGIVKEFRLLEDEYFQSRQSRYKLAEGHRINEVLLDLGYSLEEYNEWDEFTIAKIHKSLCSDLERLSCALEIYICEFINNTPVLGVAPDIVDYEADYVISFNYSNTYERIYGGISNTVAHIHGSAEKCVSDQSGIVLGITTRDDHLSSSYVEFEKYYQRIVKCQQMNVLPKELLEDKKCDVEVAIFGHSVDVSDSDIIRELVSENVARVFIYYHDNVAYRQIVANLVKILGKSELLSLVTGDSRKIYFRKQNKHASNDMAGIEIACDIRTLNQLRMDDRWISDVIRRKVFEKMEDDDMDYFYSQRKLLRLFAGLSELNALTGDIELDWAEIGGELGFEYDVDCMPIHYEYDERLLGEAVINNSNVEGSAKTQTLINLINMCNSYAYNTKVDRTANNKAIPLIFSMSDVEHMIWMLERVLCEDHCGEHYWKNLGMIVNLSNGKESFMRAIEMIEQKELPIMARNRLGYLKMAYDAIKSRPKTNVRRNAPIFAPDKVQPSLVS